MSDTGEHATEPQVEQTLPGQNEPSAPARAVEEIEQAVSKVGKATWALLLAGLAVLVLLVVFILQNHQRADVSFLGAHGHLPLGAALLLAAVIGSVLVTLFGAAREFRLRRNLRRGRSRRGR